MVTCQSSELGWEVTVELPIDFLSLGRGFVIGNPINVYKFNRSITFTFNKMHLQNNAFIHTYTHAIHFHMLSFYKSFIISQHTFSMQ